PVDPYPFPKIDEMGRCIETGPETRGRERRGDHGRGRTLAVGAGHMDRREIAFRVAERGEEDADISQAGLDARGLEREEKTECGIGWRHAGNPPAQSQLCITETSVRAFSAPTSSVTALMPFASQ